MRLARAHVWIGRGLLAFAVLHLAHHLTLVGGYATHLAVQEVVSPIYRFALVEWVLLALFALQIGLGIWMGLSRRGRATGWRGVQIWSGVILAGFVLNHVVAVLMIRSEGLPSTGHFAGAGFFHPLYRWFFLVYYPAGVIALFAHVAAGLRIRRRIGDGGARAMIVVGAVLSACIVAGLWGVFGGPLPGAEYLAQE